MVKYLVMDVDGTLTDGKIYIGNSGEVFKAFDVKDGYAIHTILSMYHIVPVIITGRISEIVLNRAKELNISEVYQGVSNKLATLKKILERDNRGLNTVAYIGDDINDIECMMAVKNEGGYIACPADAVNEVKRVASYVCISNGGHGAVREFIDKITNVANGDK